MAIPVDYASLRDQTLGSGQEEEAVTVNTRALIDKVLARYSGEWTTLRELIQNAADASATKVVIKLETLPSSSIPTPQSTDTSSQLKHVILNHTLKRLLVSNDGQPFNENDWSRLKRIAEGNPDETKIGAFGVGFYSVFADCENPFITSGSQTMAFYWKGNSLFTRRGKLSSEQVIADTCFVLDQRNTTSPVPSLISICQFLSTSLTFVALEKVELWLDDWKIFVLNKKSLPALDVTVPKDIETKSKEGMMKIMKVESHSAQVDAFWMNVVGWTPIADKPAGSALELDNKAPSLRSFFSRITGSTQTGHTARRLAKEEETAQKAILADLPGESKVIIFTRVSTVHIKSQVSATFAAELERATKKPPPKHTKIAILTSSYDETSASMSTVEGPAAQKVASLVTSIIPKKNGRIFIGFPTAQTTGLLAHISAPSLIPTVERENIDLNARYIRTWNSDLLDIAGRACRIAYIGEMNSLRQKTSEIKQSSEGTSIDNDMISGILPAATHALKQFTFQESHPIGRVGQFIEESFWTCSKTMGIEIPSSRGILPSHEVRIASEDLSFVNRIPVVPESLLKETHDFISRIRDYGLLSDITPTDIKNELDRQPLSEDQLIEFLRWASQKIRHKEFDTAVVMALFTVTTVNVRHEENQVNQTTLLQLKNIKVFLNSSRIPPELPTPPHCIPHRFTKGISNTELQEFGWEELQMVPWLRWLLEQAETKRVSEIYDMTRSPNFAAQVLAVLSKSWDTLSQSSKSTVIETLAVRTVMPTKAGMKTPSDSYFPSVKLFDDLPVLQNVNNVKEKFLKALGVRKTIELHMIFERLMTHSSVADKNSGWSHVDLIKYLVSVWSDIPEVDMTQLRNTALCPAEKPDNPKQETLQRFKVSELYEPRNVLRSIGMPILQWPQSTSPWNSYSLEGKFLKALGLMAFPPVPELVKILAKAHADQDMALFERTLKYFLENHYNNNYASFNFQGDNIPFLPLEKDPKHRLAFPSGCYADEDASLLGFPILRQDLQTHASKFGVQKDPLMANCAAKLIAEPPKTAAQARKLFGYFAKRHAEITGNIAEKLGAALIVPIISPTSVVDGQAAESRTKYVSPNSCFLGDGQEYGEIFDYVDFGPEPNLFLLKVGSKHEPSIIELSQTLIREPGRILKSLGVDKYRNLLKKLHVNMAILKKEKFLWKEMKVASFLLASKDDYKNTSENAEEDMSSLSHEWHLRSARKIVIVDDLISYTLFRQFVLAAPQDEALEDLYWALGTPQISMCIDEEPRLGPQLADQKMANQLRQLLIERVQLFLHEQNPDAILHDLRWLEKNLEVQLVQSVSLRRTLRGSSQSHLEKRTAYLTNGTNSKAVLSVTTHYETWEVSQAIVTLLLSRPKTQSTMILETFLTTSLIKLRNRGYNVDRILRRKAAEEARIADAEKQKQRQEEIKKQEKKIKNALSVPLPIRASSTAEGRERGGDDGSSPPQTASMPGAFGDSPDHHHRTPPMPVVQQPEAANRSRGLFSSISRHLGLDDFGSQLQGNRNPALAAATAAAASGGRGPVEQQEPPPPYSAQTTRGGGGRTNTQTVTSPQRIENDLQSAIHASRSHGRSELVSQARTNSIQEVASYCDSRSAQNLQYIGETSNIPTRMRFYISRDAGIVSSPEAFFAENNAALNEFASVLLICASVFSIPRETVHIFYDQAGATIAFNHGGSLFFNFRFFSELHRHSMNTTNGKTEAVVYWWVTLCHELAHNLVEDHSARHSFYTESFVQKYFPTLSGLLTQSTNASSFN